MKIRYLLLFSILPKLVHSAHETEEPLKRVPTEENHITKERTESEKQKLLKTHVKNRYADSSIFSSSKGRYTEKFNKLPSDIQNLILDLGSSPQKDVLLNKLKTMNNNELEASLLKITKTLDKESKFNKGILNTGDRSQKFIDDLTKVKKGILEELKKASRKVKIERKTTLEDLQKKDVQTKLQSTKRKNAKILTVDFNQNIPEVARTPEEQLLTQYELGVSHHSFTPRGTSAEIALSDKYHPSINNDPKAVRIINQIVALQKNPVTDNARIVADEEQITHFKKELTNHFTKLKNLAEQKYSEEYLAHNQESANAYISLRDFFAKEIQDIKENPWYPTNLEDKRRDLYAHKKILLIEKSTLVGKIAKLHAATQFGEDPESNRKISIYKQQLTSINNELAKTEKIINRISSIITIGKELEEKEDGSVTNQITAQAKPKPKPEPVPTQSKEKSNEEKALEKLHKIRDKLIADRKKLYDEIDRLKKKINNPLLITPAETADWPAEKAKLEATKDAKEAKQKELTQKIIALSPKITELTRATQDNRITSQEDADAANQYSGNDW